MTFKRMLICNIVKQSEKHLSAAEVAELARAELGSIALATVYNNLNDLADEGIVGRFSVDGKTELYDRYPMPHAHLLCKSCGKLTDAPSSGLTELFTEKTGEDIENFTLIMEYICKECKEKKRK